MLIALTSTKKSTTIVIESGGSKSTWMWIDCNQHVQKDVLPGLHPMELNTDKKAKVLQYLNDHQLFGATVYFYGAGCESSVGKQCIIQFLEDCQLFSIEVQTDVLGACKALLGNQPGTVGVMGTGAIAVQYDGEAIIQKASGWGYILGDEGSGFDIGKRLVQAYLRNEFKGAPSIEATIENYFGGADRIIPLCSQPNARCTIAGLTREATVYHENDVVRYILQNAFSDFYKTAIVPLSEEKSINLVGSVAYHLQDEIRSTLDSFNLKVDRVEAEAINNLFYFVVNK